MLNFSKPSPVVIKDISEAIDKLVFNSDGSLIAAATKDGTVGVWKLELTFSFQLKPRLIFTKKVAGSPVKHVSFTNYGGIQCILFITEVGHGELMTLKGDLLAQFQHPCPVRYMEVNAAESNFLTIGGDSAIRIWSVTDIQKNARIKLSGSLKLPATQELCFSHPDRLRAIFSNDGKYVLVTTCEEVRVYKVHDLNFLTFKYRLLSTPNTHNKFSTPISDYKAEISRDVQFFLWVNRAGELYYRRISPNKNEDALVLNQKFKFVRPTISRDGKVVVVPARNGPNIAWREQDNHNFFRHQPLILAGDRHRLDRLSLSDNGESGVAKSENDTVFAWDLGVWDHQAEALGLEDRDRRLIPPLYLHSNLLKQGSKISHPTTAILDPLGNKVAIGFKSGRIEIYGARTTPEIELYSSVSLLADLWIPLASKEKEIGTLNIFDPTLIGLRNLGGDDRLSLDEMYSRVLGDRRSKIGAPPEMTLRKIRRTIEDTLHKAQLIYNSNGFVRDQIQC